MANALGERASRRAVLATGAALAAAAGRAGAAAPAAGRGVIDTHHHMLPPFFVEAVGRAKIDAVMPTGKTPDWSPAIDLETLDAFGVGKAVISISPGLWTDTPAQAAPLARRVNEYGAGLGRDHPGRYGHFAALPLPDIDASLKEAAHALDVLKADGLIVFSNYGGKYLGDPLFAPLWQELDRRRTVVFLHPTNTGFNPTGIPESVLEYPFDTTRSIVSLIYGGVTVKHPGVRFLCAHGGGTAPYLATRIEGPARGNPRLAELLPQGATAELRKLYFDTALSFTDTSLRTLLALTDASHITFGSDFPFAPRQVIPLGLGSLKGALSPTDFETITTRSAIELMPSLA